MQETCWVQSVGREDPLEKGTATHSTFLAWEIPWTEELAGYSPWGRRESATTWTLNQNHNNNNENCKPTRLQSQNRNQQHKITLYLTANALYCRRLNTLATQILCEMLKAAGPFLASLSLFEQLLAGKGSSWRQKAGRVMLSRGTWREGSPLCSKNRKHPSRTGCRQERENYAGIMARTPSTKEQLQSGGSWLTDFPSFCLAPMQFL